MGASGIGTHLKSILTRLKEDGRFNLILLCQENQREPLKAFSSRLITMKSAIYTFKEQLEYVKKIPRCELFWAPHFNVPLLPIRAKKRLTTINDLYHLAHFDSLSFAQKVYARLMYNAAFVLSDCVVTISEFSKRELFRLANWMPKKVCVAPCPLDFLPPLNPSSKGNFLLAVGNLKPHKNLHRLVKAYTALQPEEPLYIVGKKEGFITRDEPLFQEVENNPFLKQKIFFLGEVSDDKLKELYTRARLFIFPSTYEGYGYPPLEAMACGCPVVASRVASIPEVCGDAVEYVDPFCIDSIAGGIKRLLADPLRCQELVQKGHTLVARIKRVNNQMADIIDACCNYP